MAFPATRMRRLRKTGVLRDMVRETELSPGRPRLPDVRRAGRSTSRTPIEAMPGVERLSISHAVEEAGRGARARHSRGAAVRHPRREGRGGQRRLRRRGRRPARRARDQGGASPSCVVITDVCLCEYTSHGHCGVVRPTTATSTTTRRSSCWPRPPISHARAGADIVAPSDMMDGRVGRAARAARRRGPQRDCRSSPTPRSSPPPSTGRSARPPTRRPPSATGASYQMDPANADEAVREALLDVEEGADMVMVKPALPYLDVIRRVKDATRLPVAAYNVSGEYAMLKAAAARRLARRARSRARDAHRHPPRRRGHRDHLPREGRRPMASVSAATSGQDAQPQGRRRDPARRARQAAAQPDAGQLPARRRARTPEVARLAEVSEDEVLAGWTAPAATSASSARSRRSSTRACSATSRCSSPPRSTRSNPHRAGEADQLAPGRLAQLPAQPRVQPVVHDRRRARLEARAATARSRCCSAETGAESIRQLPTLRLFKIRMDLEMEQGTEALAKAAEAVDYREPEADPAVGARHRRDPCAPGRHAGRPGALRAGRGRARDRRRALLEQLESMRERRALRRVAAILFHRRAGLLRRTAWASGACPRSGSSSWRR